MTCGICPRHCPVDHSRSAGSFSLPRGGFCGGGEAAAGVVVAKTMLHHWEEPPISGTRGSGAVFFAGCNLRCVYCQNHAVSREPRGRSFLPQELAGLFLDLEALGAHNINLITPTPALAGLVPALETAKCAGLSIPVVYNTSAYETPAALRRLEGLADVYLPDLKYRDDALASRFSAAPGYFEAAAAAILEMHRQTGDLRLDGEGLAVRGLLIRHLVLPGQRKDSMAVLDWIRATLPDTAVSLMAQYTPTEDARRLGGPLARRLTAFEYQSVVDHFFAVGLRRGYMQQRDAAQENYTPDFPAEKTTRQK
ncbi:MAG: radical SAM protein [Oscillospiraceae bacterium]|jgi:putative pyruvate formate lyase activating enzyme|nr:radical SAM protein [Oscillospiraceae bacterium]